MKKTVHFLWFLIALLLVGVLPQCERRDSIAMDEAVNLAKGECSRRKWTDFEIGNVKLIDGKWCVMIWKSPAGPGNHALVIIGPTRSDIEWVGGR